MLQVRKLVLAVAAATSMASGMAHALGLGEVSVKSALNEPLVAEIELLDTRGLSSEEIRSKLASAEDFSRAGVDRQFFLNNLKFTPVIRQGGKSFVRVTSSQSVREPFLNFLLEVYWPAGRLLKEYTLLLDPPMYTPQELVYRSAPATAPVATRAPARQTSTAVRSQRTTAPRAAARSVLQGDQYRVRTNDTLWEIALRARRGGSVHQAMLAIQDLNPDAFINGNINKLRAGQVLKLPDAEQVRQYSRAQAITEFEQRVKTGRSDAPVARQLDARQRETETATPARAEQTDSLRLLAGNTEQSESDGGSGAADSAGTDQLAQTKEQLDSIRLQNEHLASQIEGLNSQVEKLQRLLELKNAQLANLQNLSDVEQAILENSAAGELEAAAAEVEEIAAELEGIAGDVAPEQLLAAETGSADEESGEFAAETEKVTSEAEIIDEAEEVAGNGSTAEAEEAVEAVAEAEETVAAETAAKPEPEPEVASKPAPVAFEPPAEPKSFVKELMDNPMFLPAAGGGVALLLLLLLLRRRQQAGQEPEVLPPEDFGGSSQIEDELEDAEGEQDALDGVLEELDGEIEEPAGFVDDMPVQEPELEDPVVEAENLIAYGRFSQGADVLLKAIDADPQREDLRFKLLEVYADLEDRNAFLEQVEELNAMGASQAEMDALQQRYPHFMGEDEGGLNLDEIMLDMPSSPVAVETDAADLESMLAADIPALDDLLKEQSPVADLAETDDEFASLLDAVDGELAETAEQDAGIEYTPALVADETTEEVAEEVDDLEGSFELPEIEDLVLEDLELPEVDELALDDSLTLEGLDFSAGDASLQQEQTAESGFDLDLDLSIPSDEDPAAGLVDDLELSDLESLESSLDALQSEAGETLQMAGGAPIADDDELDELLDLDAGLDLVSSEATTAADGGDDVFAALEQELDDDFSFLQGDDEDKTKLDLASAWIDMGDVEGAREILDEVLREGAPEHQELAKELLARIG